jgi:hypothetical protein
MAPKKRLRNVPIKTTEKQAMATMSAVLNNVDEAIKARVTVNEILSEIMAKAVESSIENARESRLWADPEYVRSQTMINEAANY